MPTITNVVEAQCSPQALYRYITQPWLWHEWHPNSVGANTDEKALAIGDTFVEQFCLRPVDWLPLTLRRQLNYTVIDAKPGQYWEIKALANDGGSAIHFQYHFEPTNDGVRFTRILRYQIKGMMRLLAPILLRANRRNSVIAMQSLIVRANQLE